MTTGLHTTGPHTTWRRDVVVIGGSAGCHEPLLEAVAGFPADLPAIVLVTVHTSAAGSLARLLDRAGPLPAAGAIDGETARPGRIYTAVADRHLVVAEGGVLRHSRSPRQNRTRPAVDAMFRTAARWCGPQVVGVVLSGNLDDGAAGLAAVVEHGGAALVQQPEEARFPGMPTAALSVVPDATVLPAAELGRRITELVGRPASPTGTPPDPQLVWEADILANGHATEGGPGEPIGLGCPACSGGMSRMTTGRAIHYVCHVGHSYSPRTLPATRDENVESALWTAVSALEEKAMIYADLARHTAERGDERGHREAHAASGEAMKAAAILRRQLLAGADRPVSR